MDPARIVVRILVAFVVAHMLTRLSGKRTVTQIDTPSFVVALVIGDMFDDLFWSEVSAAQFTVGVVSLFLFDLALSVGLFRSGSRHWRRAVS